MRFAGLALLIVAWIAAWAAAVALLRLPPEVLVAAASVGVVAAAGLGWRARGPRRRSDPVSRIEAQRQARERFEADRLRRTGDEGLSARERREREAAARAEARVRELRERRRRASADPGRPPAGDGADDGAGPPA